MFHNYNFQHYKVLLSLFGIIIGQSTFAQNGVGIGTTTPQAALDITSTTGGFLPPRMSLEQRNKLSPLVAGLIIYQEDITPGIYLYDGNSWVALAPDNLGSHNATQRLNLQDKLLVGTDGSGQPVSNTGLRINGNGQVGIGTSNPTRSLQLGGIAFGKPTFLKMGTGNGNAQQEWELGVNVNRNNLSDVSGENYDFAIRDATANTTRLLVDHNTGNIGISNSDPAEKLDVIGNIKSSDKVMANQFRYNTSRIYHLVVPPSAFASCLPNLYRANMQLVQSENILPASVYLEGGSSAGLPGYISAPVYLPQSAIITGLTLNAIDADRTSVATSVTLSAIRAVTGTLNLTPALQVKAAISSESQNVQSVTTSLNHVVRNDLYAYQLIATLNQHTALTRICDVTITYTVSEPE